MVPSLARRVPSTECIVAPKPNSIAVAAESSVKVNGSAARGRAKDRTATQHTLHLLRIDLLLHTYVPNGSGPVHFMPQSCGDQAPGEAEGAVEPQLAGGKGPAVDAEQS